MLANVASSSASLLIGRTRNFLFREAAAVWTSGSVRFAVQKLGSNNSAIVFAVGVSVTRNSNLLASSVVLKRLTPVAFPPGLLRAFTRPSLTGSPGVVKTIGTDEVAAFAMTTRLHHAAGRRGGVAGFNIHDNEAFFSGNSPDCFCSAVSCC